MKIKTYEICNSTQPEHLDIKLTITKISRTLGFCEILSMDGCIVFPITKNDNVWIGIYQSVHKWRFEKAKQRSNNGNDNNRPYKKYIRYEHVDFTKPGPIPGTGTAGNTGGN